MTIGPVKFCEPGNRLRFICPEGGGAGAFVRISAVERVGTGGLEKDQRGKMSTVNLQSA